MTVVHSYPLAVMLCILTMFCWGSWANTLKLEPRTYPFALFYWDQAVGYLLLPLLVGLTFGSFGHEGRNLLDDLRQGSLASYGWAIVGGIVFNLANMLFMAALDYPIAIGIALVEGVVINYIAQPSGQPLLIFAGVALILAAIILDAMAYRNAQKGSANPSELGKGITLAVIGGVLMGLFYFLVQRSLSASFSTLAPGQFGPYAAVLVYCVGSFLSNLVFNTYLMQHPTRGPRTTYADYFAGGTLRYHLIGALGGIINGVGVTSNMVASKAASPAIAYGLGQGGTMIAAVWGIFVWKELKGATRGTRIMLVCMFSFFLAGLVLLVTSMLH
jgi:glucose uptake protein